LLSANYIIHTDRWNTVKYLKPIRTLKLYCNFNEAGGTGTGISITERGIISDVAYSLANGLFKKGMRTATVLTSKKSHKYT